MSVVSPLQAAVSAVVANVIALVVCFGVIDNQAAAVVGSTATAIISIVFMIVNEQRHATNTKALIAGVKR